MPKKEVPRVCAWCGKIRGFADPGCEGPSHGICDSCKLTWQEELEKEREKQQEKERR